MTDTIARDICKRGGKVFSVRESMLSYWQELAWQFYPERADFFAENTFGEEFGTHLFDDGPVVMRRDLGNSFSAMLRPRGQRWGRPQVVDEDIREAPGVADWLDRAGDIMWRWMYDPSANFVRATKEGDHDFATFGNAVLSVETNRANNGLSYRCYHLKNCAWVENADGVIDTMFRQIPAMSARQLKQRWPKAELHKDIERACEKDPEKTFCIWHVMMPVDDYAYHDEKAAKRFSRQGFSYVSLYIDKDHAQNISVSGSHEFRYVVPRWQPVQGWPYAISPATSDALPGARQLQVMARTGIEALEKSVDPPSKAVEDAVRGDINLFAGGITWVDRDYDEKSGPSIELFDVGKNAILALNAIEGHRLRLADSMFVSKLNIPKERAKTAYETQQIVEEYVRAAIPLFEPLEEGYNAPILDATWGLLMRLGAFGPVEDMPEALRGEEFRWSFDNPLQQAMERVKVQTFQMASGIVAMASEMDPAARADFDARTAARDAVRGAGAPEDWIRDKDEADQAAGDAEEVAQVATALEATGAAGEAAGKVGDGLQKLQAVA